MTKCKILIDIFKLLKVIDLVKKFEIKIWEKIYFWTNISKITKK